MCPFCGVHRPFTAVAGRLARRTRVATQSVGRFPCQREVRAVPVMLVRVGVMDEGGAGVASSGWTKQVGGVAVESFGAGPGVVVVPGTNRRAHHYASLARALAGAHTVHVVERRGRGESSPRGTS